MTRVYAPRDVARTATMCALYRSGKTLKEIGALHGITRERVRQIIASQGITKMDGGRTIQMFLRVEDQREGKLADLKHREERAVYLWGMTLDQYHDHTAIYGVSTKRKSPMHRFIEQRRNSRVRGIAWGLTFKQWWDIWQDSGKWRKRGRGKGYCMARLGDSGGYSPENVYVCTIGQNFSDSYLVKPWRDRFPSGFPSHEHRQSRGFWVAFSKQHKKNPFHLYRYPTRKYAGAFASREIAEQAGVSMMAAA